MQERIPGLAALRARLRTATSHHRAWAEIFDPDALAAALAGPSAGIKLSRDALAEAIAMPGPAEPVASWPPIGWLPWAVEPGPDGDAVRWICAAAARFDAPFFADAIAPSRHGPFNRLIDWRTPLHDLASSTPADFPAPVGLIFHWSRCGSTLAARMIEACASVAVFAEPEPIDAVLATGDPMKLRAMAAALAHGRPDCDRFVLKLDCWHIQSLSLFQQAFPETPWIFQFREPAAILASHARMPGSQMMPGKIAAFQPGWTIADHHAAVLATIADAAVKGLDEARQSGGPIRAMAVDYRPLPAAVADRILPWFGITPTAADREAMAMIAGQDAKTPDHRFDPAQAAAASAEVAAAAATLGKPYQRLLAAIV